MGYKNKKPQDLYSGLNQNFDDGYILTDTDVEAIENAFEFQSSGAIFYSEDVLIKIKGAISSYQFLQQVFSSSDNAEDVINDICTLNQSLKTAKRLLKDQAVYRHIGTMCGFDKLSSFMQGLYELERLSEEKQRGLEKSLAETQEHGVIENVPDKNVVCLLTEVYERILNDNKPTTTKGSGSMTKDNFIIQVLNRLPRDKRPQGYKEFETGEGSFSKFIENSKDYVTAWSNHAEKIRQSSPNDTRE